MDLDSPWFNFITEIYLQSYILWNCLNKWNLERLLDHKAALCSTKIVGQTLNNTLKGKPSPPLFSSKATL